MSPRIFDPLARPGRRDHRTGDCAAAACTVAGCLAASACAAICIGKGAGPIEYLPSACRLAEAASAGTPNERYSLAHLAALRAAAAVLAARARPEQRRRGRPVSAWNLLVVVAPSLREWASFFAAGASKRAAAEAGLPVITIREADDLLRDAERFLSHVEDLLHQSSQPPLHAVADHRAIRPAGSRSS
jgi:hypothetical protein